MNPEDDVNVEIEEQDSEFSRLETAMEYVDDKTNTAELARIIGNVFTHNPYRGDTK